MANILSQTMLPFSGRVQEWKIQDRVQELLQYGRLQQGVANEKTQRIFSRSNNFDAYDFSLHL